MFDINGSKFSVQCSQLLSDSIVGPQKKTKTSKQAYYNGIFPCFFLGSLSTLFSSILNALINLVRVSDG
ncbi:MAG TPA: hypothetical protein DCY95_08600, partial [Algoriphagus sp.]|nr:hypothetical protein [Algoriphagus sp.]